MATAKTSTNIQSKEPIKTVAIIQARMGARRLPGKVLKPLGSQPVLAWVVRAAQAIPGVDAVVVATSTDTKDAAIADWCGTHKIDCYRGAQDDVLARYYEAAKAHKADIVMRITADCPLLDPQLAGMVLHRLKHSLLTDDTPLDYVANALVPSWPDGLDCEAFAFAALQHAHRKARKPAHREHVSYYIYTHRQQFNVAQTDCPLPGLHRERWTLDEPADYDFLQQLVALLPTQKRPPSYLEVLEVLDTNPELRSINQSITRNEGMLELPTHTPDIAAQHPPVNTDFSMSETLLARAEKTIPIGSQTFSKSRTGWPVGAAPLFLTHGSGAKVWDVDGNEYIDFVCALMPVLTGYCDPDIDEAIRAQLSRGISFSLATTLEATLAEMLVEMIPCAEKVRFAKNGTDATSAAIRLARAHTKREHVLVCGYHGWQDWYIGTTARNLGVPRAVQGLSHPIPYNDLDALETALKQYDGQVAALIMEPMNMAEPKPGYLQAVKALLHKHGALLVFDEIVTGFRFSEGGAQQLFGVTPDLAAFGKAMGNGMPISAIMGRAEVMDEMENIFFSGTFGGEALSLAACIATLKKLQREPVVKTIWHAGEALTKGVNARLKAHGLDQVITLHGKAPWTILQMHDQPTADAHLLKTYYIHAMAQQGILCAGQHNISYAHGAHEIGKMLAAYDAILPPLAEALKKGNLANRLPCKPLEPLFKVR